VYGHHVNFPLLEEDPPFQQINQKYLSINEKQEVFPYHTDFYAISKYFSEQLCKFYYDLFGIISVILRISRVYGPGLRSGPVFNATKKALSDEYITASDDASTDFVYIDDVAKAMIAASHKVNQFEIYNIGSGEEITLYALCLKICKLCHSSSQLVSRIKLGSRFSLDISKAKKALQYKPTRLDAGLIKYIDYVKTVV
jgi:nucleoside-diphosphate-sugar epimerase